MSFRMPKIQFSKWQWALILGAPLVIGAGYYILKKGCEFTGDKGNTKPKSKLELENAKKAKNKNDKEGNKEDLENKVKASDLNDETMTPLKEATFFKNEGNICYRNGKFDEAIACYDKAIEKCPKENTTDLAIFHQNRAAAYEMLKKWSAVKEDCNKSLQYNPKYAKSYYRRAKAHEASNDMIACLDDITATCILEMFQNDSTIGFADRVLKQTGRELAEAAMKERKHCLPSNNFIRTYLHSFVNDPLQSMILPEEVLAEPKGFARAKLAMEQEQFDEVIPACTDEIESTESESQYKTEALLMRGTFHLLSGSFTEALNDLNAIINNGKFNNNRSVFSSF